MTTRTIKYWIPVDRGFNPPSQVVNLLYEKLNKDFSDWWGEINEIPDHELKGDIVLDLWLDRWVFDEGYPPDYKVWMGRWAHHVRFGGTWYVYHMDVVERRLDKILEYELTEVEA